MIAIGGTVGLAKGIIDDTNLVLPSLASYFDPLGRAKAHNIHTCCPSVRTYVIIFQNRPIQIEIKSTLDNND